MTLPGYIAGPCSVIITVAAPRLGPTAFSSFFRSRGPKRPPSCAPKEHFGVPSSTRSAAPVSTSAGRLLRQPPTSKTPAPLSPTRLGRRGGVARSPINGGPALRTSAAHVALEVAAALRAVAGRNPLSGALQQSNRNADYDGRADCDAGQD